MRFFKSIKTVNSIFFLPNLQKITLNLGINHWVFIKTIDLLFLVEMFNLSIGSYKDKFFVGLLASLKRPRDIYFP